MLTYLAVKNLTVIESVSLDFSPGLNIITGETGAGKSVLAGAMKFLSGERFNRAILRESDKKLFVEGIFTDANNIDEETVNQYEIDGELVLSRETDDSGKNKVFINGRAAPVTKLRDICQYLLDIHGQNENQFLFNPLKHISFLDFFVSDSLKEGYSALYTQYRDKASELDRLRKQIAETARSKEMYEYQLEEINSLNIDLESDSHIDERIKFLSHIEKIRESAAMCISLLKDGEISASDLIGKAEKSLSSILGLSEELGKAYESLGGATSLINDALSYIEIVVSQQESSPEELNALIDRKYKLQNLVKKYGSDLSEVLEYKKNLEEKLSDVSFGDRRISSVEAEVSALEAKAKDAAIKLNNARKEAAESLSAKVCEILNELELPSSRFFVKFEEGDNLDSLAGITAEFYISTNAGFEPGPLSTVASGGEVSRVMLALKEVFAEADSISTMLFDEIDSGISGKAAKSVAERLKKLSEKKQIIVITHLPVVAAQGETHFHISKSVHDGKSRTDIQKLDTVSRHTVIATMLAGEATEQSIMQAKELLKNAGVN